MKTFSALLTLCAGNSPFTGEFPVQRTVTHSFDVFFDLCLNKRLSKQSWGWWFETPSSSLWRHCNAFWSYRMLLDCLSSESVGKFACFCYQPLERLYYMMSRAKECPVIIFKQPYLSCCFNISRCKKSCKNWKQHWWQILARYHLSKHYLKKDPSSYDLEESLQIVVLL